MAKQKLLSDEEIKEILSKRSKEVQEKMKEINKQAMDAFYSVNNKTYNRTNGFFQLGEKPIEKIEGNKLTLTYVYSASDLTVNKWLSWWGVEYDGDPEWAFDTGFINGYHGGPRPVRGGWTWASTKQSTPILDIILDGVRSL